MTTKKPPTFSYTATVIKEHDGDTFWCLADQGLFSFQKVNVRVRLVNADELHTASGDAAAIAINARMPVGASITIRTYKVPNERYGRWLADVMLEDGTDLATWLVQSGHAKPWDGTGTKPV